MAGGSGGHKTLWLQVRAERKRRSHVFWTFIGLSLFFLGVSLLLGDMGYLKLRKLRAKSSALSAQASEIKKDNDRMRALLEEYKKNGFLVEKHAREEFGLARPDEYIFLFQDEKKK